MRRLYFIVLVFLYPSTILFSQQSFTVSGYIIDSFNGDTLIDGEVYNAKTLKTSKIDSIEKKYSLKMNEGEHELIIIGLGYEMKKQVIELNKDLNLNFFLQSKQYTIDTINIVGNKKCACIDQSNRKKLKQFIRLRNSVIKVHPYALQLKHTLDSLDLKTKDLKKRKRRKLLKKAKKQLKRQFKERIKNLYTRDGAVLIKLIHRETGMTTYELIKEYVGSLSPIYWQTIARFGKLNLKTKYDPADEDCCIEQIIQKDGKYLDVYY